MTAKKPDQITRENINKRSRKHIILSGGKIGRLTDAQKKSPSQKKSEAAIKREKKRAGTYEASCNKAAATLMFDCYTCPKQPCGVLPEQCEEQMILERCAVCGKPVRHYVHVGNKWTRCPICRSRV